MECTSEEFWLQMADAEGVTFNNKPDHDGRPGFHAIDGDGNLIGGGYQNDDRTGYIFWLQ